jgi:hypothetical protein
MIKAREHKTLTVNDCSHCAGTGVELKGTINEGYVLFDDQRRGGNEQFTNSEKLQNFLTSLGYQLEYAGILNHIHDRRSVYYLKRRGDNGRA